MHQAALEDIAAKPEVLLAETAVLRAELRAITAVNNEFSRQLEVMTDRVDGWPDELRERFKRGLA